MLFTVKDILDNIAFIIIVMIVFGFGIYNLFQGEWLFAFIIFAVCVVMVIFRAIIVLFKLWRRFRG